jgi:xylulokinase
VSAPSPEGAIAGESAYLGVDLGTSGLKLTLVSANGVVLGEAEASYDVRSPEAGWAETNPEDWSRALNAASADLFGVVTSGPAPTLAAIGFTGQMHGVVLVDDEGRPVRPAVLWPDQRAAGCLDAWTSLPQAARTRLANPIVPGMAGPILSWLHAHEPAALAATAAVLSPKDWLRSVLTGERATERSDASATLLWDIVTDDWSRDALRLSGLSRSQLPPMVGSDTAVGRARTEAAAVPVADVPVVAGGADTACALTALRAVGAPDGWGDTLVVNVGTGVQILRPGVAAVPRLDPVTHLYADTDGGWYEMLAIQNGGLALSWVQDVLGLGWPDLVAAARQARPGAGGATFVPFLTGERGGVARQASTASWSGLTASTGRAEVARAAFEGLAFAIRRGTELLGGARGPVLLSGGGAREPWLRQLIADVIGAPMRYVDLRSASAVGAAVLAARGVGCSVPVQAGIVEVVPSGDASLDEAYQRWSELIQ